MSYKVDPVIALPQVQGILKSLAHRFASTYPITFDECLSEAHLGFLYACRTYDESRGQKFSSWVYYSAWCELKNIITKRSKAPTFCEIPEGNDVEVAATRPDSLLEDLSDEARTFAILLLESPQEICEEILPLRSLLCKAKVWLVETGRLSKEEVEEAHKELKYRFGTRKRCIDEWLIDETGLAPGQVRRLCPQ